MNRFEVEDEVRIAGAVISQWRGVQGTIVEIVVRNGDRDIDQVHEYAVEVPGGQRRWFLADHLVKAVPAKLVRFFRSEVVGRWLLNPDDVALLNGDSGQLVAILQDRYDFSRRRAEAEVDDFLAALHERIERATGIHLNKSQRQNQSPAA